MVPSPDTSPVELLRRVVHRLVPKAPTSVPLESAWPGYLAEDVRVPAPHAALAHGAADGVATWNGYALPAETAEGDLLPVLGIIQPGGRAEAQDVARGAWRVETGAPLPPGTARVLPVDRAVLVGTSTVRVVGPFPSDPGIWPPGASGARGKDAPELVFPAGSRLEPRLRAVLRAGGVEAVSLWPRPAVAFATLGDELTDLEAAAEPGKVRDLLALAIEDGIHAAGIEPIAFGILGDDPESLRRIAFRARERDVDVLVLAGGLGDGAGDRTVESLQRLDAKIVFAGRAAGDSWRLLEAKLMGYQVLGLSGRPSAAASQIDLILLPALRRMAGAPRRAWDWSASPRLPVASAPAPDPLERDLWSVLPARRASPSEGLRGVVAWRPPHLGCPLSPGQEGWAVLPPEAPDSLRKAYFRPTGAS